MIFLSCAQEKKGSLEEFLLLVELHNQTSKIEKRNEKRKFYKSHKSKRVHFYHRREFRTSNKALMILVHYNEILLC